MAQAYASKLEASLGELDASVDPQTLWSNFQSCILGAASECVPKKPRRGEEGISPGTAKIIEECHRARLDGKTDCYRVPRRDAMRAMRGDMEARIRDMCETVENHLNTGDSRPAYTAIRKLRSSGPPARSPRCEQRTAPSCLRTKP